MLQREQQTQQLQQTQLSWALLVRLLGQVASALAHLHAPDPQPIIIHNDIRAANILLAAAPAGGPTAWQLKICDFGLAVQVAADTAAAAAADAAADDAAAEARIPMHTDALWVAPEVLANHVRCEGYRVTPAADVYALGECGFFQ
jgi:serine/threonine protein kinase